MNISYRSHVIVGGICLLIGGIFGYKLAPQPVIVAETHAPAIELPSGGYVAERLPDEPVSQPIEKATKELGGKLVRAGDVKVKPTKEDCPEVKIDWGLVKQDNGQRMVFTTDDGTILGAKDIPIETTTIKTYPKWTVGAIAPIDNLSGAGPMVQRHFGKLTVGAAAVKDRGGEWQGMVSVGVSW